MTNLSSFHSKKASNAETSFSLRRSKLSGSPHAHSANDRANKKDREKENPESLENQPNELTRGCAELRLRGQLKKNTETRKAAGHIKRRLATETE